MNTQEKIVYIPGCRGYIQCLQVLNRYQQLSNSQICPSKVTIMILSIVKVLIINGSPMSFLESAAVCLTILIKVLLYITWGEIYLDLIDYKATILRSLLIRAIVEIAIAKDLVLCPFQRAVSTKKMHSI